MSPVGFSMTLYSVTSIYLMILFQHCDPDPSLREIMNMNNRFHVTEIRTENTITLVPHSGLSIQC